MSKKWIQNFEELAINENRKAVLSIIEAGLDAIDTEKVIFNVIRLDNNILYIGQESFDLSKFQRIKVAGFGKASGDAAIALEKILGDKIQEGVVIGLEQADCKRIQTFTGSHPRPSMANIEAGRKIYDLVDQSTEGDLIIAVISGGGSALLCPTKDECEQGIKLYDLSIKSGAKITELNTLRKHTSLLKGGGLAKIAYPATVIGLIFSDVPGDNFENVASGPTYKDVTTAEDAGNIIKQHNVDEGEFVFNETPKEDKYFEKVHNFVLVSNQTAVIEMQRKSVELGFEAQIVSTELYAPVDEALGQIFSAKKQNTVVLGAGEPKVNILNKSGRGGRNLHMGLTALGKNLIDSDSVFVAFASDGMDNTDSAGAIVDKHTIEKMQKLNLNVNDYLQNFNSYLFFEQTGDLITTGPTGANVSDLMILLNRHQSS